MEVGFVGAGSMAAALARGLARLDQPPRMAFADSGSGRAASLAAELGGSRCSPAEIAAGCDLIVLAVKPGALDSAAGALAGTATPLVSLLGATTLERLRASLPGRPVLRTMPNLAVELGRGVICHAPADDPAAFAAALELLGRVADLYELPEAQLDAATAVMGCSPAYLALACEAIAGAGAEAGLAPGQALELVRRTAAGTGELLLTHAPDELQRAVASPGGSTEAGLEALRENGVPAAFATAVNASLARMSGAG
jgi:pyrroline-5-carboxylate reductase